ncbi:MAG: ABC transporter ATP-binding protein [Lachnospiraceae bacterium]
MSVVLAVSNLSVALGDGKKSRKILQNISFEMQTGEIVGLVGESGSGKTTLCKTILGFHKSGSGSVQIHTPYPQMIFQDSKSSLNPSKKIRWILKECQRTHPAMTPYQIEMKIADTLEKVHLTADVLERYPSELSGGQRQRISIAIAVLQESGLVLADEPVSSLDVTIQTQILELMKELRTSEGTAFLLISHDLNVVAGICDRLLVMHDGTIIEQGEVKEIMTNPKQEYTKELLKNYL